jgi:uncharacterized membrane protein YqjE
MTMDEGPRLADFHNELRLLAAQLRKAFALRGELARLEIREDLRRLQRWGIFAAAAGALMFIAFPLPAVAAAECLDGWGGIARWAWLLIFAGGLFLLGLTAIAWAWRFFRRRFTVLRQTLEELREDLVWLREWCDKDENDKMS